MIKEPLRRESHYFFIRAKVLNMMSLMVLQDCACQVCLFFIVYPYRQNAVARLGLFFQLSQDVPLDGDIAP
jgi:hypothetical protein